MGSWIYSAMNQGINLDGRVNGFISIMGKITKRYLSKILKNLQTKTQWYWTDGSVVKAHVAPPEYQTSVINTYS